MISMTILDNEVARAFCSAAIDMGFSFAITNNDSEMIFIIHCSGREFFEELVPIAANFVHDRDRSILDRFTFNN